MSNISTKTKKTVTAFTGITLAILILASTSSLYLGNKNIAAQEEIKESNVESTPLREKTISVTGTATSSTSPDLLVIQFGIEIQNKTAKDALDENSLSMNQIIDAIKLVGITEDEINTANFNIYPVYEGYEDQITKRWTQELVGYRVSNIVTVETANLNSAADIIDGAVAAGANRVDSVYFTLSPEQQLKVSDELIGKAVQNAQKKAENALIPLNHKIIGVKMVSLSDFGLPPPPMPYYDTYGNSYTGSFGPTPIFSSMQEISTTANVVFIIGSN
jgi:hypothetical protein